MGYILPMVRIITILVALCLGGMLELGWAVSSSSHDQPKQMRIIKISNPDSNQVKIKQVCAYFENDPSQGVCTPIVTSNSIYLIDKQHGNRPIQRIALVGETNSKQQAVCLLYINTLTPSTRFLTDLHGYTAQVHYVTGDDMVCSLSPNLSLSR